MFYRNIVHTTWLPDHKHTLVQAMLLMNSVSTTPYVAEIEHYSVCALLRSKCSSAELLLKAVGEVMNTYHIHTARMNRTLNGNSVLEHYKCGNPIEIRNGIMFDFYLGLPHTCMAK